ncbi:hypothetical protein TNCV_4111411 [Trichonephila clavipes]|nr:hypothetical protein TNCV_4111411 [Trichonephila clavipes]
MTEKTVTNDPIRMQLDRGSLVVMIMDSSRVRSIVPLKTRRVEAVTGFKFVGAPPLGVEGEVEDLFAYKLRYFIELIDTMEMNPELNLDIQLATGTGPLYEQLPEGNEMEQSLPPSASSTRPETPQLTNCECMKAATYDSRQSAVLIELQ